MSEHPRGGPVLTRVVVVPAGDSAVVQEFWAESWTLLRQDDGATLKILGSGDGSRRRRTRTSLLAIALGAITGAVTGS
ncbi:hypothetical protein [Rhodococcus sp. NCIMB 12038]|uniref:hypothetical protein n=1 Tax=Rhodococcus sp. NCIMB 12038 TaxID=933800 RepID=UPI00117B4CEB|nr:hypothetical protein [Rhodococcus sp. NCIMB 12038]